jgi:hypothetical protein
VTSRLTLTAARYAYGARRLTAASRESSNIAFTSCDGERWASGEGVCERLVR